MIFGYTPFDPLVVLAGALLAIHFLVKNPMRLMAWLPVAMSLYFFIPTITFLTLWQVVPLLLLARVLLTGRVFVPVSAQPIFAMFVIAFLVSFSFVLISDGDIGRAVIRALNYSGMFALFSFSYEMGRKPETHHLFLKGMVIVGVVYAGYGVYQIFAMTVGLPFRGIVRGTQTVQMASEMGIPRINSLASEPKRLGYVLFLSGLACFALGRMEQEKQRKLNLAGIAVVAVSLFTLSGSYFFSIVVFLIVTAILYPVRYAKFVLLICLVVVAALVFAGDSGLIEAISAGNQRRLAEIEVGLDGEVVYRQEFYATDFLSNHPKSTLFGVGVGQYFTALSDTYGEGVGYSNKGSIIPLNSNFLELVLDFGGIIAVLFYGTIGLVVWRLHVAGEHFYCLGLLFLSIQSFSLLTLGFLTLFLGIGAGRLTLHRQTSSKPIQMPAAELGDSEMIHSDFTSLIKNSLTSGTRF